MSRISGRKSPTTIKKRNGSTEPKSTSKRTRKRAHPDSLLKDFQKSQTKIFSTVVENGIDFLTHSSDILEKNPKYSVIAFCAGIELVLKSRLILEHWTLVLADPSKADRASFLAGDFRSVSTPECIDRLSRICGSYVSKEAQKSFAGLVQHRNRLVHFYHDGYTTKVTKETLADVVAEQCAAWQHLHQLILNDWRDHFGSTVVGKFAAINSKLHLNRRFLRGKFRNLRPDLERRKRTGDLPGKCAACGYRSAFGRDRDDGIYETECIVCGYGDFTLRISCPNCDSPASYSAEDVLKCPHCQTRIDAELMSASFGDTRSPKDRMAEPWPSACVACECGPIIHWAEKWLCLSCLTSHDFTDMCGYCGSVIAGGLGFAIDCPECGEWDWEDV